MKLDYLSKYKIEEFIFKNRKTTFCKVRKSYIHLTQEEKVRQSFLSYLINDLQTPIELIQLEYHTLSIDNYKGRVDILVNDPHGNPFIIYECKSEKEYFTDDVFNQALRYFTHFRTVEFIGFVIGSDVFLFHFFLEDDMIKHVKLKNHPTFSKLLFDEQIEFIEEIEDDFEHINPLTTDTKILEQFYNFELIGKDSNLEFYPFFINFYNWYFNKNADISLFNYEDRGIKTTAFGSSFAKLDPNWYRCFSKIINNEPILFCIALSTVFNGKQERTALQVGIETLKSKRLSLHLNLDNSIQISDNSYEIWHNGAITIGRKGASKIANFIEFVSLESPNLIVNNKIFLGEVDIASAFDSTNSKFNALVNNLLEYCWIREKYRNEINKID